MTKQDFVNRGLQYFAQKEYDRAIIFFRKALECDEKFETAYSALCESLNRINEIDEAHNFALKWLEINDKNPLAHLTLSRIYVQQGLKQKASSEMEIYNKLQGVEGQEKEDGMKKTEDEELEDK